MQLIVDPVIPLPAEVYPEAVVEKTRDYVSYNHVALGSLASPHDSHQSAQIRDKLNSLYFSGYFSEDPVGLKSWRILPAFAFVFP